MQNIKDWISIGLFIIYWGVSLISGLAVYTDKGRSVATLFVLQFGNEFKRVGGITRSLWSAVLMLVDKFFGLIIYKFIIQLFVC